MQTAMRILAIFVDLTVCAACMSLLMKAASALTHSSTTLGMIVVPLALIMFVLWPVIYFGLTTGLWAQTPGKRICRLVVIDAANGARIDLKKAFSRETLKLLSIASFFGIWFCLVQFVSSQTTWYDAFCKTDVVSSLRASRRPARFSKHLEQQYNKHLN